MATRANNDDWDDEEPSPEENLRAGRHDNILRKKREDFVYLHAQRQGWPLDLALERWELVNKTRRSLFLKPASGSAQRSKEALLTPARSQPKCAEGPTTTEQVRQPTQEIGRQGAAGEAAPAIVPAEIADLAPPLRSDASAEDQREWLTALRMGFGGQGHAAREAAYLEALPMLRASSSKNPEIRLRNALGLQGGAPSGWPKPKDLPPERPEAPPLPEDLLPTPLRSWCRDIATRMQVPPEMVAMPAIVTAASLVGRNVMIHPKRLDDWRVVPNIWGAVVASPGMLKSPALADGMKPFKARATAAMEEIERESCAHAAGFDALKAKEAALKKLLQKHYERGGAQDFEGASLDAAGLRDRLRQVKAEIDDCPRPRRYFTNDPTVEKLCELLRDSPRGILLERDELAGWMASLDRNGREGDLEFYLEGWDGGGGFTQDRIGRGTIHVPANCISIFGGIQPGKLKKHVDGALAGGNGADGLLQRFQALVWPEFSSEWEHVDRPPDRKARAEVDAAFRRLDMLSAEDEPRRFSTEAQALFDDWLGVLERRLRSGELAHAPAFLAHLAKYRSLMPSLALVFHLLVEPHVREASLDATKLAAAWCDFLETHARKIYAAELSTPVMAARELARRLRRGDLALEEGVTVREIYRREWSGLKTAKEVTAALNVLRDCEWLEVQSEETGGRNREAVYFNPRIVEVAEV
jgi:putative DNA primase/helicase